MKVIGTEHALIDLETKLEGYASACVERGAAAVAIKQIAAAAMDLQVLIAGGTLTGMLVDDSGRSGDGDRRKALDVIAENIFTEALAGAPVAIVGSGAREAPAVLDEAAPIAATIDPLDGSSNIDTNISVGTIFSILPVMDDLAYSVMQPGHRQLAAGFVIYGPQTCLVLSLGDGTDIFTLDPHDRVFRRTMADVRIPTDSSEYAINAANYRHWDAPVQAYVDDNVAGIDGPRGRNFNMCWIDSLVAEAYRILIRGGIFLYPGDRREGHEQGRISLVYEANPLAMIIEQAGGLATDGEDPILDLRPKALHQRVPLIFGSSSKVERVRAFHDGTLPLGERSPLFGRRGLFRH